MDRARRGWGAEAVRLLLAVSLSALAIASAFTAIAQASEWEIEGEALTELGLKEEKTSGNGGPITLSVPSLSMQVKCLKAAVTGTIFSGGTDQLSTSLTECTTEVTGKVIPTCKIVEPAVMKTKSQPINVKGSFFDKFEAQNKEEAIAVLSFPAECALTSSTELRGSFGAKVPSGEQVERQLELAASPETALSYGKRAASLAGNLSLKLSGGNVGKEWQRVPATKLCKQVENPCAAGETWPVGTAIKAEKNGEMKFVLGATTVDCKSSKLEGATVAVLFKGTLATVEFTECTGGGGGACTVTALKKPWAFEFAAGNLGDGKFTIKKPEFEITCEGKNCLYSTGKVPFDVEGGMPAKFSRAAWGALAREPASGPGCALAASWEGTAGAMGSIKYKFTAPSPLFLTP